VDSPEAEAACFVYQHSTKDHQLLQTPGARIFDRSTSFASVTLDPAKRNLSSRVRCKAEPLVSASPARTAKKLLRKKKNESWAMRTVAVISDRRSADGQRPPLQSKQVRLSSWRKLVMRNRPLCFVLA